MFLLKFRKQINENNKKWVTLYGGAVDKNNNLAEIPDKEEARKNLEIVGEDNNTHYHDQRYFKKEEVQELIDNINSETNSSIENTNSNIQSIDGRLGTIEEKFTNGIVSSKSTVAEAASGNKYLVVADGKGEQYLYETPGFYVTADSKLVGTTIECSGNITANKTYNAVWNDYAELMPRGEITEPGDIIMLDMKSDNEQYVRAIESKNTIVAGVHSDEFGMLIGGEKPENNKDLLEYNIDKFIPVALSGRVHVKFVGKAEKGAKVVPSSEPGYGRLYNKETDSPDNIIGYLVEADNKTDKRKLKVRITK